MHFMETYVIYILCVPKNLEDESNPLHSVGNKNKISVSVEIPDDLTEIESSELFIFLTEKIIFFLNNKFHVHFDVDHNWNEWLTFKIEKGKKTNDNTFLLSNYYQFGSWVKIRSGIFDQNLNMPISNLKGKIIDFYNDGENDVFFILWCSESLRSIPEEKIKKCIKRKISPLGIYLQSDMVLPIFYYENPKDILISQIKLLKPYILEKFEKEFYLVFSDYDKTAFENSNQIWEHFFENLILDNSDLYLKRGKQDYKLLKISGSDEKNGVWVEVENRSKTYLFPLNDFSKIISHNKFQGIFDFYLYWSIYFFSS